MEGLKCFLIKHTGLDMNAYTIVFAIDEIHARQVFDKNKKEWYKEAIKKAEWNVPTRILSIKELSIDFEGVYLITCGEYYDE